LNKKIREVEWKERRWKQFRPDNGEGFGSITYEKGAVAYPTASL